MFGVDINPNSVKICRLRLWIELLKHAYYNNDGQLETLPNIDINIKCGNSLVSRFSLDADLKPVLKKSKWSIEDYQVAVQSYRRAKTGEEKYAMKRLIDDIKRGFSSQIHLNDPVKKRLDRLSNELYHRFTGNFLFDPAVGYGKQSENPEKKRKKEQKKLEQEIEILQAQLNEKRDSEIFRNAFEWRFEFPEVLNDDGNFVGFDVVIGNPPYIRQEEFSSIKTYLQGQFNTFAGTADLYVYFVELSMRLLRQEGDFIFIIPNKWMRAGYGKNLRNFLQIHRIEEILDFGDLPVFEEATTYPCIIHLRKTSPAKHFTAANIHTLDFLEGMPAYISKNRIYTLIGELQPEGWTLTDSKVQKLLAKIKNKGIPLGKYVNGKIFRGVLTGLNEAFVIDQNTRDRLIQEDPKSAEIIKPFLAGRDIKRYQQPVSDRYLIFTRRGINIRHYPAILKHLEQFRTQLEPKPKNHLGHWPGRKPGTYKWYEIQDAVDYYEEFEKDKIIVPAIVRSASYGYDRQNCFSNDKTTIIPTLDMFLLGILNSSLVDFYLSHIASTKQNGYYEYKPVYLAQLPIFNAIGDQKQKIEMLTRQVLQNKSKNISQDTTQVEKEIDRLVYELYELTEEEVQIVENNS